MPSADLTPESADEWLDTFQAKEQEATEKLLSLDQKMSVAQTAHSQFEQAYQLVVAINGRWRVTKRGTLPVSCCATASINAIWPNRCSRCACA